MSVLNEEPPGPHSPSRWQGRYAAVRDLLEAYAGRPADDSPSAPSAALSEYLGVLRHVDPTGPCVAAAQLRDLLNSDVADPAQRAMLPWPQTSDRRAWMATVAQLIESAVDSGFCPAADIPATAWAWRRRFPRLFQLFGAYFGQDFPLEHPDLPPAEAERRALTQWRGSVPRAVFASTVGELHELLALRMDRGELEIALGALGRDIELALDPALWLRRLIAVLEAE
jgi:hypothetical protein